MIRTITTATVLACRRKTLRITGIVVCGGLLLAPQVVCYLNASPGLMKWMNLARLLFPLTFYILANLLIDEGRARERSDQESRRAAR